MNFLDSSPKPKPCPHCGSSPYSWAPIKGKIAVRCSKCEVSGPLIAFTQIGEAEAEKQAVKLWNQYTASTAETVHEIRITEDFDPSDLPALKEIKLGKTRIIIERHTEAPLKEVIYSLCEEHSPRSVLDALLYIGFEQKTF